MPQDESFEPHIAFLLDNYADFYYLPTKLSTDEVFKTYPGQFRINRLQSNNQFAHTGAGNQKEKKIIVISDYTLRLDEHSGSKIKWILNLIKAGFQVKVWVGDRAIPIKSNEDLEKYQSSIKAASDERVYKRLAKENITSESILNLDYFAFKDLMNKERLLEPKVLGFSVVEQEISLLPEDKIDLMSLDVVEWLKSKKFKIELADPDGDKSTLLTLLELFQKNINGVMGEPRYDMHLDEIALLPNLESLGLLRTDAAFFDQDIPAPGFPKLNTLGIYYTEISFNNFIRFLSHLKKINKLVLGAVFNHVELTAVDYQLLSELKLFHDLKEVQFTAFTRNVALLLNIMAESNQLELMNLDSIDFSDLESNQFAKLEFSHLTKLRACELDQAAIFLSEALSRAFHLEEIYLYGCQQLSELTIRNPEIQYKDLKLLEINNCYNLPCETIIFILKHAQELQRIAFSLVPSVALIHPDMIADICLPKLESVFAESASQILSMRLDTFLTLQANSPRITTLHLSMSNLDDEMHELISPVAPLPYITILDVSRSNIRANQLINILIACKNLRILKINRCSNEVDHLNIPADVNFEYIVEIHAEGVSLSPEDFQTFLSRCPNLEVLNIYGSSTLDWKIDSKLNLKLTSLRSIITNKDYIDNKLDLKTYLALIHQSPSFTTIDLNQIILTTEYSSQDLAAFDLSHIKTIIVPYSQNLGKVLGLLLIKTPNVEVIQSIYSINKQEEQQYREMIKDHKNQMAIPNSDIPVGLTLTKLTMLDLRAITIGRAVTKFLIASPNLEVLDLTDTYYCNFPQPLNIMLPKLKSFNHTKSQMSLYNVILISRFIPASKVITKDVIDESNLILITNSYVDDALPEAARFEHIKNVNMSNREMEVELIIPLLHATPNVETLKLNSLTSHLKIMPPKMFDPGLCAKLQELNVATSLHEGVLEQFIIGAPNLVTLELYMPSYLSRTSNEKLVGEVPLYKSLEKIKLRSDCLSHHLTLTMLESAKNLTYLSLSRIKYLDEDYGISELTFPALEEIDLWQCHLSSAFSFIYAGTEKLKKLGIRDCHLNYQLTQQFTFSELTELQVNNSNLPASILFDWIRAAPKLNVLNVGFSEFDEDFINLFLNYSENFETIRELRLRNVDLPHGFIELLLLKCPNLKSLYLSDCSTVTLCRDTENSYGAMMSATTSLTYVSISSKVVIPVNSVEWLFSHSPNLEKFYIEQSQDNAPVSQLDLYSSVAFGKPTRLTRLSITGRFHIINLLKLISHNLNLESLDIDVEESHELDMEIINAIPVFEKLASIDLAGRMDFQVLVRLLNRTPNLHSLNCQKLSLLNIPPNIDVGQFHFSEHLLEFKNFDAAQIFSLPLVITLSSVAQNDTINVQKKVDFKKITMPDVDCNMDIPVELRTSRMFLANFEDSILSSHSFQQFLFYVGIGLNTLIIQNTNIYEIHDEKTQSFAIVLPQLKVLKISGDNEVVISSQVFLTLLKHAYLLEDITLKNLIIEELTQEQKEDLANMRLHQLRRLTCINVTCAGYDISAILREMAPSANQTIQTFSEEPDGLPATSNKVPLLEEGKPGSTLYARQHFTSMRNPRMLRLRVSHHVTRDSAFTLIAKPENLRDIDVEISQVSLHEKFLELRAKDSERYELCPAYQLKETTEWQPLPSIQIYEKMISFYSDSLEPGTFKIQYDDKDNMYYIQLDESQINQTILVEFLLDLKPELKPVETQVLPPKIKNFVEYCRTFTSPNPSLSTMQVLKLQPGYSASDVLEARYREKIGSCINRSIVFNEKFKELKQSNPELSKFASRIADNDVHAFIELNDGDSWQTYDLGGYPGDTRLLKNPHLEKVIKKSFAPRQNPTSEKRPRTSQSTSSSELFPTKITENAIHPKLKPWLKKRKVLTDSKVLLQKVLKKHKNSLIKINEPDDYLAIIAEFAKTMQRPYFVIDSPDDLHLLGDALQLAEARKFIIQENMTKLKNFLTNNPDGVVFINWSRFSHTEITAFHSFIDVERNLNGVNIDTMNNQFPVISFYAKNLPPPQEPYKGIDFITRHKGVYRWQFPLEDDLYNGKLKTIDYIPKDCLVIDLFGTDDWEALLTGNINIEGAACNLAATEFFDKLEDKDAPCLRLHINNPSIHKRDFKLFWQQALQQGHFLYYGKKIKLHPDFELTYSHVVTYNTEVVIPQTADNVPILTINPSLFYRYFAHSDYLKDDFHPNLGWFAPYENQVVKLIVTDTLTALQWSRLLAEAKRRHVQLTIELAENVILPQPLQFLPTKQYQSKNRKSDDAYVIYEANGRGPEIAAYLAEQYDDAMLINFDTAHDYGDLSFQIKAALTPNGISSAFFLSDPGRALLSGKNVIIEGKLPPELIQALAPLLIIGNTEIMIDGELKSFTGKLILVTDTKIPIARQVEKAPAAHLTAPFIAAAKIQSETFKREVEPRALTIKAWKDYKDQRSHKLLDGFKGAPIVFFTGETGVGKTTFITKDFETEYFNKTGRRAKLYIGEESMQTFFAHQDPNVDPFLFVDEANLSNKKLSILRGMNSKKPHCLADGHYYPLKPDYHRVILVGNDKEYGGSRQHDEFLNEYCEKVVCDMPNHAYFYYEFIRPVLSGDKTLNTEHAELDHDEYHHQGAILIDIYETINNIAGGAHPLLSPRHLETMTVMFKHLNKIYPDKNINHLIALSVITVLGDSMPDKMDELLGYLKTKYDYQHDVTVNQLNQVIQKKINDFAAPDDNYVFANSRLPLLSTLDAYLNLRSDPDFHFSLCLQGVSRAGKSSVVEKYLARLGIEYVKFSVGASFDEDKKNLLEHFHAGKVIIFDELNAGGPKYEKLINTLIMRTDENNQPPRHGHPLFIFTQNEISMSGRQALPPALQARITLLDVKDYTTDDIRQILAGRGMDAAEVDYWSREYKRSLLYTEQNNIKRRPTLPDLLDAIHSEAKNLQKEYSVEQLSQRGLGKGST